MRERGFLPFKIKPKNIPNKNHQHHSLKIAHMITQIQDDEANGLIDQN
jgi:hypothetical protein